MQAQLREQWPARAVAAAPLRQSVTALWQIVFVRFDLGRMTDDGANAALLEVLANRIGIIGLVGDEGSWRPVRQLDQPVVAFAVCRFARRELEGDRSPSGITETMNFTAEPAPRAAKTTL
jgi:hypothetical protein